MVCTKLQMGWSDLVTTWLVEDCGCKQFISDPCLFSHPSIPIMLGLFVDDFGIAGTPEAKAVFISTLRKRFKISDKGLMQKYIGVNVDQSVEGASHLVSMITSRSFYKRHIWKIVIRR